MLIPRSSEPRTDPCEMPTIGAAGAPGCFVAAPAAVAVGSTAKTSSARTSIEAGLSARQ